jgi:hypothetical protein
MLNFLQVLEIAPTEWGTRLPAVDQDSRWSSDAGLRAVRAIAWSPYSAMFSAVDGEADRQPRRTSILPRQTCPKFNPPVDGRRHTNRERENEAASFLRVVAPCRRHRADDFLEETRMVSTDPSAAPLTPSEHQTQLRRAVIASTVGTTIEWHDFFLYSTVTGLVFAKLFSASGAQSSSRCCDSCKASASAMSGEVRSSYRWNGQEPPRTADSSPLGRSSGCRTPVRSSFRK